MCLTLLLTFIIASALFHIETLFKGYDDKKKFDQKDEDKEERIDTFRFTLICSSATSGCLLLPAIYNLAFIVRSAYRNVVKKRLRASSKARKSTVVRVSRFGESGTALGMRESEARFS